MTVPGLPTGAGSGGPSLLYLGNINDVDVFADAGSPAGRVDITVRVGAGVLIGASTTAAPAMTFAGFTSGSTFRLDNQGSIVGAGGDGGDAGAVGDNDKIGGGGGGGAGIVVGTGGAGHAAAPTQAGANGTDKDGGGLGKAPGIDLGSGVPINLAATDGTVGGTAIDIGAHDITIDNGLGEIFGGGGGGGGGKGHGTVANNFGGDGGGPGEAGLDGGENPSPGALDFTTSGVGAAAGAAIVGSGTIIWVAGGTNPNVKGAIPA